MVLLLHYAFKLFHRVVDVFWITSTATLGVQELCKDPTLVTHNQPWDRFLRQARRGQWRCLPEPSHQSVHDSCIKCIGLSLYVTLVQLTLVY